MRYAVIGTGAVGGFYGARLQRAGCEVHFLLRSDFAHVRDHGLAVRSRDGDFRLPEVHAYDRAQDLPPCDVVIVALKTTANHRLPGLLPPALKPGGTVLMLQNGLGVEGQAAALAPAESVLGGLTFICSHKSAPGVIEHLDYGDVTLGQYAPGYRAAGRTARLDAVAADFERAGLTVRVAEDLGVARWKKLVWNIPFNGLSVVLDATTAELVGQPATRVLVETLMRETRAGAAACGHPVEEAFIGKMMADTERMTPYRTSMKLDYDAGRSMELEAIYARPLHAAAEHGRALPATETLYQQLAFLDGRRGGAVGPREDAGAENPGLDGQRNA